MPLERARERASETETERETLTETETERELERDRARQRQRQRQRQTDRQTEKREKGKIDTERQRDRPSSRTGSASVYPGAEQLLQACLSVSHAERETLEQNSFCRRVRVWGKFHSVWALLILLSRS
jgi:hypothetical protein